MQFQQILGLAKQHKTLVFAGAVGLAYAGFNVLPAALTPAPKPAAAVLSQPDHTQTEIVMTVAGGREMGATRTLLNSKVNYRDPENVTVVLPGNTPLASYLGKTITVSGETSTYRGKDGKESRQIVVRDLAKQVKVQN